MAKSKPRTKIQPKTEGQRLLLLTEGTEIELANKVACSHSMIGFWRRGTRMPSEKQRERLELVLDIPRRAWDFRPGEEITEPEPEPEPEKPRKERSDDRLLASRAKGMDTLEITKLQIDDILDALDEPELTDGASAKLRDTLAKALALRTRLERDRELLEDRFVRDHPAWIDLRSKILTALKPYPAAAKAVIEAIGGSGGQ